MLGPNISGSAGYASNSSTAIAATGSFSMVKNSSGSRLGAFETAVTNTNYYKAQFDAADSNSIYSKSSIVQPASYAAQYLIKS